MQAIKSSTLLERDFNTDIFLWISENLLQQHLRTAALLESILQEHFLDQNSAKGTFDEPKMVTCYVKGCSN